MNDTLQTTMEVRLADLAGTARLARDVIDAKGRCLLAAGSVLTEDIREQLQRCGVISVLLDVDREQTAEELALKRAQIEAAVMRRFRNAVADSALCKLRDVILTYRLSTLE